MITLTALLLFTGLNYEAIERLPIGAVGTPTPSDRRWLNDATTESWFRDSKGINVFVIKDKPVGNFLSVWVPWTDEAGSPWLSCYLTNSRIHLWQDPTWRALHFSSKEEWAKVYAEGNFDKQFPPKENFGVIKSFGSSGETGSLEFLKCEIHADGPCPGPGPCPRPQPRPRPDDSLLPPININPQINLDSNVIAAAIFASFLLMTAAFTLLALAKRRAS